jgi:putative tricarboxylic transport membrane protein
MRGAVMSDDIDRRPEASGRLARVRGPQDLVGGLALMAVAAFALWAARDLGGMRGFSFGPGTAPRLFAGLLLLLGAAIALIGVLRPGAALQRYGVRGPFFVTVSIVLFAAAIRPLGLILTGILTFLVAAMGSPETRWTEAIVVGVLLTLGCAVLFPYVLGLPLQMLPRLTP